MISVARRTENRGRDPGNRIFAKAYAARLEVTTTPAAVTAAVMTLFRKYRLKLARVHASAKLLHRGNLGQKSGANGIGLTRVIVSADDFSEVLTI
jgi:hypothetical protein